MRPEKSQLTVSTEPAAPRSKFGLFCCLLACMSLWYSQRKILLVAPFLFVAIVAIGLGGWKEYPRTHIKTDVEVIKYYPESHSALACIIDTGELLTFSFPESDRDLATGADLTQTGSLLILTGEDYWLLSSPMQYPSVSKVEYNGNREDFVEKHLSILIQEYQNSSLEELTETIEQLPNLNKGEKAGLLYLAKPELDLW